MKISKDFNYAEEVVPERKCFCCGNKISAEKGDKKDDFENPVNDATAWETNGNHGSSYDPDTASKTLKIFICDDCLFKNADRVCEFKVTKTVTTRVRKFNPKNPENRE